MLEPGAVSRHDLTGNGRADYIIDTTYVRCERLGSIFCGTGGCELSIVVALPRGKFREVFRQKVIRYEIEPDTSMKRFASTCTARSAARPARSRAASAGGSMASGFHSANRDSCLKHESDHASRPAARRWCGRGPIGRVIDRDLAGELQRERALDQARAEALARGA